MNKNTKREEKKCIDLSNSSHLFQKEKKNLKFNFQLLQSKKVISKVKITQLQLLQLYLSKQIRK